MSKVKFDKMSDNMFAEAGGAAEKNKAVLLQMETDGGNG